MLDIAYWGEGDEAKLLDVFMPSPYDGTKPVIFGLHGYVLRFGDLTMNNSNRQVLKNFARYFVELGYPVVIPDLYWSKEPYAEQQAKDAFCALAWVHANAGEYGFDTQRIVAYGHYYGAATATKLAAVDDASPYLTDCPHPAPQQNFAAVVAYGDALFTPAESVESPFHYSDVWADSHGLKDELTQDDTIAFFETISAVPHTDWSTDASFDDQTRKLAALMPMYQLNGNEPKFLVYSGTVNLWEKRLNNPNPTTPQGAVFVEILETAGVDYEFVLEDNETTFKTREEEIMAPFYEAMEQFFMAQFP
jgi:acetyl esterase/lipase